ncbi:hypothetical protein J3E68DRAFT_38038 [Trichoderma sp. SZMC 28012]
MNYGMTPATAKDCIDWNNYVDGRTCQETRDLCKISPEEFTKWNPSVILTATYGFGHPPVSLVREKLSKLTRFLLC